MTLPQARLRRSAQPVLLLLAVLLAGLILVGCKEDEETTTTTTPLAAPAVSMGFPTSLTGDATAATAVHGGPHCDFAGQRENDPLRNGYTMTRWLVGTVAGWLCITDFLSDLAAQLVVVGAVPANGTVVVIPPDPADPGGPTGISVQIGAAQSTVQLFFKGTQTAGIYLSWAGAAGSQSGKLVVLPAQMSDDPATDLTEDAQAPTHMRMDFSQSATARTATMYMAFDPYNEYVPPSWDNPWATGFRVDAVRTAADGSFSIKGYISTKDQLDPGYPGTEIPALRMLAVSDAAGTGASVAGMTNLALGFVFTPGTTEGLGYFLFDKDDRFYFTSTGAAEWIKKAVTGASYKGGLTYPAVITDALIDGILAPMPAGTTAACRATNAPNANCVTLLNAVFDSGNSNFAADVNNTTPEPADSRKTALDAATFLTQATPDGGTAGDWTGVFDLSFTPPAP